eukprot:SAG22_NODE_124_length_18884_cov_34.149367_5_plen_144_part_00
MDPVNSNFDRVAEHLPFTYGIHGYRVSGDPNKKKMKKRNLRNAIKSGYQWDSYKHMTFDQWRDANGYSNAECEAQGIKYNSVFPQYQKYRNAYYRKNKAINNKFSDIQSFDLICNLLDECQYQPPVTPPRNVKWDCDWVIGCI